MVWIKTHASYSTSGCHDVQDILQGPESRNCLHIKWPESSRWRSMHLHLLSHHCPWLWPLRGWQLCWSGWDSRIQGLVTATGHLSLRGGGSQSRMFGKDFKQPVGNSGPYELWATVWTVFLDLSTAPFSLHPPVCHFSVIALLWQALRSSGGLRATWLQHPIPRQCWGRHWLWPTEPASSHDICQVEHIIEIRAEEEGYVD